MSTCVQCLIISQHPLTVFMPRGRASRSLQYAQGVGICGVEGTSAGANKYTSKSTIVRDSSTWCSEQCRLCTSSVQEPSSVDAAAWPTLLLEDLDSHLLLLLQEFVVHDMFMLLQCVLRVLWPVRVQRICCNTVQHDIHADASSHLRGACLPYQQPDIPRSE